MEDGNSPVIKLPGILTFNVMKKTVTGYFPLKLRNVKLKTILIYPPYCDASQFTPLGIPILQGYLKNLGYKNIESIDFNHIYNTRFRTIRNKKKDFNLKRYWLSCKEVISTFYLRNHFSWSLNYMLNSAIKNNFFCEEEKKKVQGYLAPYIINKNPKIVGISVIYPYQIFYSLIIAKIIKEIKKETFIVLGGAQVTKHIKYLTQKKGFTRLVDGLIVGDGEEPIARLINEISENNSLENVPNLYFKLNSKNKSSYVKTCHSYYYNPKEFITPDFSGLKIKKILPIRASVGCSWGKCRFCTFISGHKKYIYSKPEDVIFLIKKLIKKHKTNRFWFIDDALSVEFLKKFSKLVLEKKIKIRWGGNLCLQLGLLNERFVKLIARAGCKKISFGLESASQRILKLMNKPQKDDCDFIKDKLVLFKKNKIATMLSVIFGFPSEKKDEAKMTLNFLLDNKDFYGTAVLQQFSLEDNTPIIKKPFKFGVSKVYKVDKNYGIRLGFYYKTYKGMTPQESKKFTMYANRILKRERKLAYRFKSFL